MKNTLYCGCSMEISGANGLDQNITMYGTLNATRDMVRLFLITC